MKRAVEELDMEEYKSKFCFEELVPELSCFSPLTLFEFWMDFVSLFLCNLVSLLILTSII